MKKRSQTAFLLTRSGNPKSTIQNHKSVGIFAFVVTLAIGGAVASAQQPGKIFRIGYLDPTTASGSAANLETFRQDLSKLGWIEGKNLVFEYRFAEMKPERIPELAAELVRLKVDLIVTSGVPPALEILKDAVPKLARVGLLKRSASNPGEELQLEELRVAASALKVKLEEIKTQIDAQGLESAFKTAKQKQVGAIMTTSIRLFSAERKRIVELATKHRLPAIYNGKEYVDEGGLMTYGVDNDDQNRKKAHYVDKILKGAKPADLPVQQATKFEFIINLKAAKQIGLTLSPEFLARANRVIK